MIRDQKQPLFRCFRSESLCPGQEHTRSRIRDSTKGREASLLRGNARKKWQPSPTSLPMTLCCILLCQSIRCFLSFVGETLCPLRSSLFHDFCRHPDRSAEDGSLFFPRVGRFFIQTKKNRPGESPGAVRFVVRKNGFIQESSSSLPSCSTSAKETCPSTRPSSSGLSSRLARSLNSCRMSRIPPQVNQTEVMIPMIGVITR